MGVVVCVVRWCGVCTHTCMARASIAGSMDVWSDNAYARMPRSSSYAHHAYTQASHLFFLHTSPTAPPPAALPAPAPCAGRPNTPLLALPPRMQTPYIYIDDAVGLMVIRLYMFL